MIIRIWVGLFLLYCIPLEMQGQNQAGQSDSTLNPSDIGWGSGTGFEMTQMGGLNAEVQAIHVHTDGAIWVGGIFNHYNTIPANRIVKLNPEGSIHSQFNPGSGPSGTVHAITSQPDGKLLIAGRFLNYNGRFVGRIARLFADGRLDTTFNVGSGANEAINAVMCQPDGKILIGGAFTTFNGHQAGYILRLNSDGSRDTMFNPGSGLSHQVRSLAVLPHGKILIGGDFTSYNGTNIRSLVRTDSLGAIDLSFSPQITYANSVSSITLLPDGKVVVAGWRSTFNPASLVRIACLDSLGAIDPSFNPGAGANDLVLSTALQPDGKLIVGGQFSRFDGVVRNRIARLNADGSLDTSFDPQPGITTSARKVLSVTVFQDSLVFCGGDFVMFHNFSQRCITRLLPDGKRDDTFNPTTGADNSVLAFLEHPHNTWLVGGRFNIYNNHIVSPIIRIHENGELDTTFPILPMFPSDAKVYAMAHHEHGSTLVAGSFQQVNQITRRKLARIDSTGALDMTFDPSSLFGNTRDILDIAVQPDQKIIAVGDFTQANQSSQNHIIRLLPNGAIDPAFNPGTGPNNTVRTCKILPDSSILIAGDLNSYNGIAVNRVAKLFPDGTLDTSFKASSILNPYLIRTLALMPDGKINVGGGQWGFDTVACLFRLHPDGTLDSSFVVQDRPNGIVHSLCVLPDDKLMVGGQFTRFKNKKLIRIAKLNQDGTPDSTFDAGSGPSDAVLSMKLLPNNSVWLGGEFTAYNGLGRNRLARIFSCNPSFTSDSIVACDSFRWIDGVTYFESNQTATWLLTNAAGCDSLVSLYLIVNGLSDTTIIQDGNTLQSQNLNANTAFQWLDCNQNFEPIQGATLSSFIPEEDGSYALRITEEGCTFTSECILFYIKSRGMVLPYDVSVYPNPVGASLFMKIPPELDGKPLVVLNALGQPVYKTKSQSGLQTLDLTLWSSGTYYIQIQTQEGLLHFMFIKK